jgi:hypothetical protein
MKLVNMSGVSTELKTLGTVESVVVEGNELEITCKPSKLLKIYVLDSNLVRIRFDPSEKYDPSNSYALIEKGWQKVSVVLFLKRATGIATTWVTSNYYFIDDLRKQILLWRSLSTKEHETYIKRVS